ncbi:ABC transporter substrate-binding protein [Microbacterium sp. zg.Y909]|uniref:ABC transporter substrate-binding protein n=1 Tax=Microbacterium sp. zg.Y909 TaxID=2969413 RepID=UPI00214B1473|nr:sugar ABC transporter substrate-binding protein [Microbacterium sp. zg.Y909]
MTIWSADENHLRLFDGIADEYKSNHPEIGEISFETLPFADYDTTLTTQIAGGAAPDLAWLSNITPDIMAAGGLAPLSDALSAVEGYDFEDILPSTTAVFSQDGEVYAYPFSNSPFTLFANKSLLAEAGYADVDFNGLTWQDLDSIAAAVHSKTGKAGWVMRDFDFSRWQVLQALWSGWGATTWDDKGCQMTSPEMVDALTYFHDAVFKTGSHPGPGVTADFFAGDAAFTVSQVSRASLLDGSFEFDVVPLPAGPIGDYAAVGQAGIGVLSGGKHVAQATDFLAYLTNPENAAKLAAYFPPPRESLLTGEQLAEVNPTLTAERLDNAVVSQLPKAEPWPMAPGMAEITSTVQAKLDPLWTPGANVETVLAGACEALDPLLSK